MALYLCHACSNIKSPSGESCIIEASEGVDPETILHGAVNCVMGYKKSISNEERKKYAPIILPAEVSIETDFYKIESEEARVNLHMINHTLLWISNIVYFYRSNEDQLWVKAEEEILKVKRRQSREVSAEQRAHDEAVKFFVTAKVCRVDPLSKHAMVR